MFSATWSLFKNCSLPTKIVVDLVLATVFMFGGFMIWLLVLGVKAFFFNN